LISALIKLKQLLDNKSKLQFSLLFILLLVKSFLDGFGLGMIAPYIAAVTDSSTIVDNEYFQKINFYTKIQTGQELILVMSIILITFFIIKNVFSLFVMYLQSRLLFTKRSVQGRKLFEGYMRSPFSFHLEHNSAELDRNIRIETPMVYGFVEGFLLLCSNLFLTFSIFTVLLLANWQAVMIMGFFIIIFSSGFLFFSGRYSKRFGKEVQVSQLHIGQAMKEGFTSIIEVKLLQLESFFPSRYFRHMMSNARANWRQTTLGSAPTLFFEVLAVGSLVAVITVLSIRNYDINKVLPILGLFSFAFIRLIPSVTAIIKSLQDINFRAPAVEVIFADFKKLELLSNATTKHKLIQNSINFDLLSFEDVNFSFPTGKNHNVVNGLNLSIPKGIAIGITGPSGSGKTTLINLILGLLKPDSGVIRINNEEMEKNLTSWRSKIGYVPQSINLLDASIRDNVAMGLEGSAIDNQKVWSVLKEANLFEFVKDFPHQLDTFIGENGVRISGGQRQRLGLARALYRDPEVIIFDEATSALDMETEKRITEEIMKLSGKRTLIIVAHRISTIKECDVIYYLKNGEIVNSGKYEELKKLNRDFKEIAGQV
jgi:ATP-binding cassette, subfamily B, bacterial PglK